MKRFYFAVIFAAIIAAISLSIPASAAPSSQVCTTASGGSGQCPNAWNGGPLVKTQAPGAQNNNFSLEFLGTSTTNNPISGNPVGLTIVDFKYLNISGECIADQNNDPSDAHLAVVNGACGGVGWGSRFLAYNDGCSSGFNTFVNVHWSPNWTNRAGMGWTGSGNGDQMWANVFHTTRCLVPR